MKKKALALVAMGVLVAALALVGCGGGQSSSAASTSASASSAAASSASSAADSASAAASSAAASSAAASPAAAASSAAASSAAASQGSSAAYIGEDAAKTAALAHAGVSEADCTEMKVKLDTDDNPVHYDVEFKAGGMEYDYDIDPVTGDVLKYSSEVDD